MNKISKLLETIQATVGIDVALFAEPENGAVLGVPPPPADAEGYCSYGGFSYAQALLSDKKVWLGFASRGDDETVAKLIVTALESADCDDYASLDEEERLKLLLEGGLTEDRFKEAKDAFVNDERVFALALCAEDKHGQADLRKYLETFADEDERIVAMSDKILMYFRKKSREYVDSADFAFVLYENIKEEIRVDLTIAVVGEIADFETFASSYKLAVRTLRWGKRLNPKQCVFRYEDTVLVDLLASVDKAKLTKALSTLSNVNVDALWGDEELVNTAEEFLRCSLNVSETGRKLYVHRNTLMNRLDKIRSESGLNLHSFEDAEVFRLVSLLRKLTQNH